MVQPFRTQTPMSCVRASLVHRHLRSGGSESPHADAGTRTSMHASWCTDLSVRFVCTAHEYPVQLTAHFGYEAMAYSSGDAGVDRASDDGGGGVPDAVTEATIPKPVSSAQSPMLTFMMSYSLLPADEPPIMNERQMWWWVDASPEGLMENEWVTGCAS
jgi:hypothetical protein